MDNTVPQKNTYQHSTNTNEDLTLKEQAKHSLQLQGINDYFRSVFAQLKYSILIPMRHRMRQHEFKQKLIIYGLLGLLVLIVIGFITAFGLFAWYGRDLPSPGKLSQASINSTIFYDRNGKVLYELYKDKNRVPVTIKGISKYLQQGTVAIEDKDFYHHQGISEKGILRAFVMTALGKQEQGGSTITQQLIKNVLLTSQHSLSRKIKEAILAVEVERRYTKDQILEMYLNEAPYGGSYWGVETASHGYFNKDPKDLSLMESAILAGMPQRPSYYSPFIGKKDAWKDRTTSVLRRMKEDNYISAEQEASALKEINTFKFQSQNIDIIAPHFVFYIKKQIEDEYGTKILDEGLKIKTTLDLDIQTAAEKIVKDNIKKLDDGGYKVSNGAAVVIDSKTGEILAYVGSHDYNDEKNGQFDVISQGLRQPGSTLKPLEYAVAFEKGYTPSTVLMDTKTVFSNPGSKDYVPENYDLKFRGPVQIRFALANSLNIPAVKMLGMIGLRDFLQKASDMGMTELAPTTKNMQDLGLSASLGGGSTSLLHLTSSYTVFANGGNKVDIQSIKEISNYQGKTFFTAKEPKTKHVVAPEVSFLISHILSDDSARSATFGSHSLLSIPGKTVAVKTGTTDNKVDNYAEGFTKSVTLGVWVGNNDYTPMNPKIASGITGATPIWHDIMVQLMKKYPDGIMEKPDKVKSLEVDSYLGGLPHDGDAKRTEIFVESTEPKEVSPFYKKIKLSKSTGKLANQVEEKNGNYDEKEFLVFQEKDPISTDGKNRWQEGIDAWVKDQSDAKFHPPTDVSDASSEDVVVSIKDPSDKQTVGKAVNFRAKIYSVAPIKSVKFYINGSEIKNFDGNTDTAEFSKDMDDGVYEFKVVGVNEKDKRGESVIRFGVNKPYDSAPTATPSNTATPTATGAPAPTSAVPTIPH